MIAWTCSIPHQETCLVDILKRMLIFLIEQATDLFRVRLPILTYLLWAVWITDVPSTSPSRVWVVVCL